MSVFILCEQAIGLVRGKRLILQNNEKTLLENLDYEALAAAYAQDEAVVCALHFASVRDSLLQLYPWIFARKTETPAQLSENTTGWRYSFVLPDDCLKVLAVIAPDNRLNYYKSKDWDLSLPVENVELVEYEEAGGYVYANRSPIYIRYTAKITDETKWAAAFRDVFIIKLAEAIAPAVGVSAEIVQGLDKSAEQIFQAAVANGLIRAETGLPRQRETMAIPGINIPWLDYSGIKFRGYYNEANAS